MRCWVCHATNIGKWSVSFGRRGCLVGFLALLVTCVGVSAISAELLWLLGLLDADVTDPAHVGTMVALGDVPLSTLPRSRVTLLIGDTPRLTHAIRLRALIGLATSQQRQP